jgi:Ca2+-binding RTX toxin-like protein
MMEQRVLLSAAPFTSASRHVPHPNAGRATLASDGTLAVTGTSAADAISVDFHVYQSATGNTGSATVKVNGTTQSFSTGFQRLTIDAQAGNDSINVTGYVENDASYPDIPPAIAISLLGGAGNDLIITSITYQNNAGYGAGVATYADGGTGNDSLFIQGGTSATLIGGTGNDVLASAASANDLYVTMNGGNGDDQLSTGSAGNAGQFATLNGGNGNDTFYNDDIDDHDTFIGGRGTDTILIAEGSGNDQDPVGLGTDIENVAGSFVLFTTRHFVPAAPRYPSWNVCRFR